MFVNVRDLYDIINSSTSDFAPIVSAIVDAEEPLGILIFTNDSLSVICSFKSFMVGVF